MLHFVCVKHGTKYGPEFVNILHDMVIRNLFPTEDADFVCFTEDASGLSENIVVRGLPPDVKGWWCKLALFANGTFPTGDRVIYMDLDTVLLNPLEGFTEYAGKFAICRDFMGSGVNSSVMLWQAGWGSFIWDDWIKAGQPDLPGGDQEWIERNVIGHDIIQDIWPGSVISYKMDCLLRYPPKDTVVVCFHGEPKPDNCGADWVQAIWKMGGGTAMHLTDMVCNTGEEALFENIRSSCARPLPWLEMTTAHDGHAVIVGGGPSAVRMLDEIRWRKEQGQTIISLNGAHDWLRDHGIVSDWQVLLDARPENARFVARPTSACRFIASQCHPSVFDAAGPNVMLWHSNIEGLDAVIPHDGRQEVFIGAGSTAGLCAMSVAMVRGYRMIHLYGFDSSFADEGHAYAQPENDRDRPVDVICEGRSFRAAPWMIAQANQFQVVANDLANNGCTITVHGDGLLPWIAKLQQQNSTEDTHAVQIDGIWWPSKDRLARPYILNSVGDIEKMLAHTPRRKIAVQAGGNVGIWPCELAKHFEEVLTFEPDPLNFECLEKNIVGTPVKAFDFGLGDISLKMGMERDPTNCGAHYLTERAEDGVQIIRLDDWNLTGCDFLQLDVEGFELPALKGAERTIGYYKPTIVVELKGHGERYKYRDSELVAWLGARGYSEKARFGRDVLFTQ